MKNKEMGKSIGVFLLYLLFITVIFMPAYGTQTRFSFLADEWTGELAVFWNPAGYNEFSSLATPQNAKQNLATDSNLINGLTPDTAVKNLDDAIKIVKRLSSQLEAEVSDIIIYAMSPMTIPDGMVYTVKGSNVTILPWEDWDYEDEYIFSVEGGQLILENITIRSAYEASASEELPLVYMSAGTIQLGSEVEVGGTFVLDYHHTEYMEAWDDEDDRYQEPRIDLLKKFDFAGSYQLDLQIPESCESEIIAVKALFSDELAAAEYAGTFTMVNTSEVWELYVEEWQDGILYETATAEIGSETSVKTQKQFVARKIEIPMDKKQEWNDFVNLPLGGNVLNSGDETKLVVMEADGDPLSGYYQAYTANVSGLRQALFDIYTANQPSADYIMYFGTSIINIPANIFANTSAASSVSDVTFASLSGRINTMVLTGQQGDVITDEPAMTAPAGTSLISVQTAGERYFGCHIILRNIRHNFNAINYLNQGVYLNGYSLTLGGNSWQMAATRYFGGGSTGTVTAAGGITEMNVYSTGIGESFFVGGMLAGTLAGDTSITIHNTSGNLIHIRGGGLGTLNSSPANVTGNVTNTINGMATANGGLYRFVGGVVYGNIEGAVTNTISGEGRFAFATIAYLLEGNGGYFIGGSVDGDIGSDATLGGAVETDNLSGLADTNDYIIKNNIDTSRFTFGQAAYLGTNYRTGIIKGNIVNIVHAGTYNKGSISVFSGGSGHNAVMIPGWENTFSVNPSTAKVTNIEAGLLAARSTAKYQLYGNITNVIAAGSICAYGSNEYWFRGAGWGYMEGNAYSVVGTEGPVYFTSLMDYSYSTTVLTQGFVTDFDLVGGGGNISANGSFCIKGDTALVTMNVRARWTYGGNFGGVQIGNSLRNHHGGVVDTCEGTGYNNYIMVGDGRTEVHGGQVDWFLCGGGWNDAYQDGNVSVEVYDEPNIIINASMGGTYGASATHYISGDSSIVVRGGDFSGTARYPVYQGFSAGPSNSGYIYGNGSVTLDLRGNQHGFSIEAGDSISGGRRLYSGDYSYLGTNADNTITLNILTDDAQTDLLNGLNIYGDCAGTAANIGNTRAGNIIINVNAPGAVIGSLYATNYPNLSGGVLRKNVQVNLVSAKVITGLCAGNGTENITNTVAFNSAQAGKYAVINVGPQSADPADMLGEREFDQTADGLPHPIHISTNGIIGFTSMDIRKRLLVADKGDIKNGLNANVENHNTDYHQFGDLTLHAGDGMDGAGLGIASPDAVFIAGSAYVMGEGLVYIQSTGQANQIVLTDIMMSEDNAMDWLKTGNVSPDNNLQTTWFGASSGWRVITLNPDKMKAKERVTPVNFRGMQTDTGETFIGDSDIHFSGTNGYAVAIPGTVYTWEVTEGEGMISHNVPVSTGEPAAGESIQAYGTVAANTLSKKGSLAIPGASIPNPISYPTFSFVPDTSLWERVAGVDIYGSDQYVSGAAHNYQISAGDINETKRWTASGTDKDFSFDIKARFTQAVPQVMAQNVIITEAQAAMINSSDDIIAYTQASGEPLFANNITAELLAEIQAPLGQNQIWRSHEVRYWAGDQTLGNQVEITVYVTVVSNDAEISANQQYALYAKSAVLTLAQAQAINNQADLDGSYTKAIVILANGTTAEPVIDNSSLAEIMGATDENIPKTVPVRYTYVPDIQAETVTKEVTVHIKGFAEVDITISKLVEGDYGDRTKAFSFQIYFRGDDDTLVSAGTQFNYIGSTIPGSGAAAPDNGVLTLNELGSAEFVLRHGQQINILDVPAGKIQIIETVPQNYSVSYNISEGGGTVQGADTGFISVENGDRSFEFINTKYTIVPTGLRSGNIMLHRMVLLVFSVGTVAGAVLIHCYQKRRSRYD